LALEEETNLSRVFKQSSSFIPEKIFAGKSQAKSGWRSVSIQEKETDSSPADTEKEQNQRHTPKEQDSSKIEGDDTPIADLQTDFSSPDASLNLEDQTLTPDLTDGSPQESQSIDLELLQEEAYNRGLQDGHARAEADYGSSAKALIMACQELNMLRETILNNSMEEMQNLVLIIAEKIIRHSVTEQNRTIIDTVKEAIRQAVKSDEFVVQVNPADLNIINTKSKEFIDSVNGLENIIVHSDPSIERGGCKIDSSTSTVDATLASQLQLIENALKGKT
jgi:flagellar assembly protein FliH